MTRSFSIEFKVAEVWRFERSEVSKCSTWCAPSLQVSRGLASHTSGPPAFAVHGSFAGRKIDLSVLPTLRNLSYRARHAVKVWCPLLEKLFFKSNHESFQNILKWPDVIELRRLLRLKNPVHSTSRKNTFLRAETKKKASLTAVGQSIVLQTTMQSVGPLRLDVAKNPIVTRAK